MPRLVYLLLAGLACACARSVPPFSEANARAYVDVLAGTIGSRPIGTAANARAREYLIDRLAAYGFDVRVQEADAELPDLGLTARVANIVAVRRGSRPETIALVAHYDSSPHAPGATDDGFGVGVVLEAARALAERRQPHYTLMVLLTDGEEAGLLGAAAAVKDPAFARVVRACINLDSIGSDGPAMLFETGPESGALVGAWARGAPRPRGASYAIEIYRRLPNDTDFSIFRSAGIPGLNFAAIGDSYPYHTARDLPERLTGRVLRQAGENVMAIVERLDRVDLSATAPVGTYFDVGGRIGISYGRATSRGIALGAIVLGLLAWLRAARRVRLSGDPRWAQTAVWALAAVTAVAAGLVGATWALRAAREVYHPWYAHPDRLFALLAITGFLAAWTVWRGASRLPVRFRANGDPLAIWVMTLPVWLLAAILLEWQTPSAAYLWTIPLLAAGVLLNLALATAELAGLKTRPPAVQAAAAGVETTAGDRPQPATLTTPEAGWVFRLRMTLRQNARLRSSSFGEASLKPWRKRAGALAVGPAAVRVASVGVLAVTGALWLPDAIQLLRFTVSVLGRQAIVTPVYVYPGALLAVGVMIVPPLAGAIAGRARPLARPGLWTAIWLTMWVVAAGLAYSAPAYTDDRPLRRQARYVYDQNSGRAFWEVGSNEPGLDLQPAAAGGAEWRRVTEAPPTTVPLSPVRGPFSFRADGAVPAAPPATLAATLAPRGGEVDLEIVAIPLEPGMAVTFVLPRGIRPLRTNLVGIESRAGRWAATYVAPPAPGVAFRAAFGADQMDVLRRTAVVLTTRALPGGTGWQQLPPWLPQVRTVWSAGAFYVMPAFASPP